VPQDQFFDVRVNIGNEFGLFRRGYVKQGERAHLQCSLRNNVEGRYKLVFQAPLDPSDVGDAGSADATGKLTLNSRGKASFRVALATVDGSEQEGTSTPLALEVRAHEASTATWNLFPVVSLPLTVAPAGGDLKVGMTGDLGVHCCRAVAMDGLQCDILLAESPGNLGAYWCLARSYWCIKRWEKLMLVGQESEASCGTRAWC
jgi:hypothetical protein